MCIRDRECILNDEYQFTLEAMYPIRIVPSGRFDGFVESIGYFLPDENEQITEDVEVVSLISDFVKNLVHWNAGAALIQ